MLQKGMTWHPFDTFLGSKCSGLNGNTIIVPLSNAEYFLQDTSPHSERKPLECKQYRCWVHGLPIQMTNCPISFHGALLIHQNEK